MSQPTNSSLLSLSFAAANAQPIPIVGHNNKHHRRISSASKTRRRLSDARDAANRPTSAAAAALSLASLSLSSSPPSGHHISTSLFSSSALVNDTGLSQSHGNGTQILKLEPVEHATNPNAKATMPIPIVNGKNRKRGMDHKCESCSKIYRHPSCLIKHRWEHTPHWREASKYVLSKHQQVQLLEAAAILSHLSPSSSSLPEDRSLWPSFLSGGSLPPPENTTLTSYSPHVSTSYNGLVSPTQNQIPRPTSSSVPTSGASYPHPLSSSYPANGAGPKLHDYTLPNVSNGVTQFRPGLLGIPNDTKSIHDGVMTLTRESIPPLMEEEEDSRRDKYVSSPGDPYPRLRSHSGSGSIAISNTSGSRSRSTSTSEEEDDEMSIYIDGEKRWQGFTGRRYSSEGIEVDRWDGYEREKKVNQKEGWDGMDMEMEMD